MKFAICAARLAPVIAVTLAAQSAPQNIVVQSPTLKADQTMPRDYTPDGRNVSPPLTWSGVPAGTKQLAVLEAIKGHVIGQGELVVICERGAGM